MASEPKPIVLLVKLRCGNCGGTVVAPDLDMLSDSMLEVRPFWPGTRGDTATYHTEPYVHVTYEHIPDPRSWAELKMATSPISGRIDWEGGDQYCKVPVEYLFVGKEPGFEDECFIHYGDQTKFGPATPILKLLDWN